MNECCVATEIPRVAIHTGMLQHFLYHLPVALLGGPRESCTVLLVTRIGRSAVIRQKCGDDVAVPTVRSPT